MGRRGTMRGDERGTARQGVERRSGVWDDARRLTRRRGEASVGGAGGRAEWCGDGDAAARHAPGRGRAPSRETSRTATAGEGSAGGSVRGGRACHGATTTRLGHRVRRAADAARVDHAHEVLHRRAARDARNQGRRAAAAAAAAATDAAVDAVAVAASRLAVAAAIEVADAVGAIHLRVVDRRRRSSPGTREERGRTPSEECNGCDGLRTAAGRRVCATPPPAPSRSAGDASNQL